MNYSACGIMLYIEWTIGSTQLEDTEQCLFLAESMQPSSTEQPIWCNDFTCLDEIVLAQDDDNSRLWIWKRLCIIMMRDMKVTMIMDYQVRLWGLCIFIQFLPLRPPSTCLTTREHNQGWLIPFCEGICQCLSFDETTPPMPKVDPKDGEYLHTADLDDPV